MSMEGKIANIQYTIATEFITCVCTNLIRNVQDLYKKTIKLSPKEVKGIKNKWWCIFGMKSVNIVTMSVLTKSTNVLEFWSEMQEFLF